MLRKSDLTAGNSADKKLTCLLKKEVMRRYLYGVDYLMTKLIDFGNAQWGSNNWVWKVTKQEVDFINFFSDKYCVGSASYVKVSVKTTDEHRQKIGIATYAFDVKKVAVFRSKKCSIVNGLCEAMLSFGGKIAIKLNELIEEHRKAFVPFDVWPRQSQGRGPPPQPRAYVSFVQQPVVGGMVPPMYEVTPRLAAPSTPNVFSQDIFYTYHAGPRQFPYKTYEHPPRRINHNFGLSQKNLVNNQSGYEYHPPEVTPAPVQSRWIKPTLFYDGFWTEQKVKRWLSGQFILEETSQNTYFTDRKALQIDQMH